MNFRILFALMLRYLYLYTRTPMRMVEMLFWPVVDLLVWGFMALFLKESAGENLPGIAGYLLGGLILWDVLFRSQQGVSISFLEDIWTRNLLNVFVAPVRIQEYLGACFGVGILRVLVTAILMVVIAWGAYQFNLLAMDFTTLVPAFANLILFGWSLGLISAALILRWGQAAEGLAWAVPFIIQPISCVFYPVSALPDWIQWAAWCVPCTPVFEGMRQAISGGGTDYSLIALGFGVNLAWFVLGAALFAVILRSARERGGLTKFASS